jgi:hypothetical protein
LGQGVFSVDRDLGSGYRGIQKAEAVFIQAGDCGMRNVLNATIRKYRIEILRDPSQFKPYGCKWSILAGE